MEARMFQLTLVCAEGSTAVKLRRALAESMLDLCAEYNLHQVIFDDQAVALRPPPERQA